MPQWKVTYIARGFEPPYPFGKQVEIVEAQTRAEAIEKVRAKVPVSLYCTPKASRVTDKADQPAQAVAARERLL